MTKITDQMKKHLSLINKKSGNRRNSNFDDEDDDGFEEDHFQTRNSPNAIVIGTSQNGKIALNREKIEKGELRGLITGMTGSGKSFATRNIIEQLYLNKTGVIIILDPEGEYYTLREKFDFVILGTEEEDCDILITSDNAEDLALKVIGYKINVIIDLSDADDKVKQEIATNFLELLIKKAKHLPPIQLIIDEASIFAKRGAGATSLQNIKCTEALKKTAKLGRKRRLCTIYCTQRVTHLHNDITSECDTFIIGKCTKTADINRNGEFLRLKGKEIPQFDKLQKEFYIVGEGLEHYEQYNQPIKYKSSFPLSVHKSNSVREGDWFPKPKTEIVKQWIVSLRSIKDVIEGAKKERHLALVETPKVQIDSSSFIPKIQNVNKNNDDDNDDDIGMPLSDGCEICGKTAVAFNRCEKCADYESQMNEGFDDYDEDDDDEKG